MQSIQFSFLENEHEGYYTFSIRKRSLFSRLNVNSLGNVISLGELVVIWNAEICVKGIIFVLIMLLEIFNGGSGVVDF